MNDGPRPPAGDSHFRALRLLEILAGMNQPATLPDIAAAARLSVASTYRVLQALDREGFLDHIGRSGYRVGARTMALASLLGPRPALIGRARPVLISLSRTTNETASLHLRSGHQRTMILAVEPPTNPERRIIRQYERAPLVSGCSSLAILAHLPDPQVQAIIEDQSAGRASRILEQIETVRADGYAMSFGANHRAMHGVAVALVGPDDGLALGAVALAGLPHRMPEARLRHLATQLVKAAAELTTYVAAVLGPHSEARVDGADVVVQDIADPL